MVPQKVRANPADMATRRDKLAARLADGDRKLGALQPDDPRYAAGFAKWLELEAEYEALCVERPEPDSQRCLDCGRVSVNGLTPCRECAA